MIHIPDPLHPAVVHFPIVLILLATLTTILCFFFKKDCLLKISVLLFAVATVAAYFAEETGGDAYSKLSKKYPQVSQILNHHADLAGLTLKFTAAAAFLGLLTLLAQSKKPQLFMLSKALFLLLALTSSYYIYQTGKFGGEMIYGNVLNLSDAKLSETIDHKH